MNRVRESASIRDRRTATAGVVRAIWEKTPADIHSLGPIFRNQLLDWTNEGTGQLLSLSPD